MFRKMTAKQWKQQNAVWQDKYYSYSLHITNGGAMYLGIIEGHKIDKNTIANCNVVRLDGVDLNMLVNKVKNAR